MCRILKVKCILLSNCKIEVIPWNYQVLEIRVGMRQRLSNHCYQTVCVVKTSF